MTKECKNYTYRIIKHIIYGKGHGKRVIDFVHFDKKDDIYDFLFDCAEKYEKSKCNFIVEHTQLV